MALTIVWSLYATGLLALGFWRTSLPQRVTALALFLVAGIKLIAVDMAGVDRLYRIVSGFVLGLLVIVGSYLYHRYWRRPAGSSNQ